MTKRIILLAITIAIIVTGVHFFESSEELLGDGIDSSSEYNYPFAIARQAKSKYFDKAGKLSYTFTADKLEHFRSESEQDDNDISDSYTLIEQPNIHMYREDAPWVIEAQNGKILRHDDTILLENNVNIRSQHTDKTVITLKTDELRIHPDAKLAETDSKVTIQSDSGIIRANGMKADLQKKKIRLISNVRGEHDPLKINRVNP